MTLTEENQYKEDEPLTFIRVRFLGHNRSYPFLLGKRKLSYGQKVVAMSERGMAIGYINSFPYKVPYSKDLEPILTISRAARDDDFLTDPSEEKKKEGECKTTCEELIAKHQLNMTLTHVELTAYGKKLVLYFIAPQRVDFRALLKDLISTLRLKVELRQISSRERASALGGIGSCGRALCCSTFLKRYGNVSMKMAKVQNLSLTPIKINGLCGQIKCCISYEEETYREKRTRLPKENEFIQTATGDRGKVLRLMILEENFDMLTDQGVVRRYRAEDYEPQKYTLPSDWKMPEKFEYISHEIN